MKKKDSSMKNFLTLLFVLALGVIGYYGYEYFVDGEEPHGDRPGHSKPKTEYVTVNGVKFKMVGVDGGTYTKGYGNAAYQVSVSSFSIGATEVTQELWIAVMGSNPSYFSNENNFKDDLDNMQRPVESFSWSDCRTFISKLNKLTGKKFRLPKEAEWEFAARGGNNSKNYLYSGGNEIHSTTWWSGNARYKTHPVATKSINELGLFDMSGNVEEICEDSRSGHGGSYSSSTADCHPSSRSSNTCPDKRVGFRLAL